jgi:hypothetical protein
LKAIKNDNLFLALWEDTDPRMYVGIPQIPTIGSFALVNHSLAF